MIRVTLYSRQGCHLCDQARADLETLQAEIPHKLVEIDIESEPRLLERYLEAVPVVQVGPYTLNAPFSLLDLRVTLAAARDGRRGQPEPKPIPREQGIFLTRALGFFARHWLAMVNLLVLTYVGLPFLAPVLMRAGADRQARWIYLAYSPLCHQLAYRSWFLFGLQAAYPLEAAGTPLVPYEEATGLAGDDLRSARSFLGNERLGYKAALCERDVAIYGGLTTAGIAFALVRGKLKPIPLWLWVLIGLVPIALDGGTQFLGAFPWFASLTRESTPLLRSITGGLFGVMNAWLAYPYIEETMAETRAMVTAQLAAADRSLGVAGGSG